MTEQPHTGQCESRLHVAYQELSLDSGIHEGTLFTPAGIHLAAARGVREYLDPYAATPRTRAFAPASWTSPPVEPGFGFVELVPTWHASTPGGSWIEISARARCDGTDRWSEWQVLARWADHDDEFHPTSVPSTAAVEVGPVTTKVATDTLVLPAGARAWQLRATLLQPAHSEADPPVLTYAGAMVSATGAIPAPRPTPPNRTVAALVLAVPALSQRIHAGHYPRWGGGGDAWCSPTSVTMVLRFWGVGPDDTMLSWVDHDYPDPAVYHAVRHCFDYAYAGAGNWSFNVAYAARFGLSSFVTRLRGLDEAEAFLRAGIPLVAGVRVDPAQLSGADYTSGGHLLVIVGMTDAGDVVVNDPGGRDPATVRRTYRRDEFERAWFTSSGGLVYVIHPPEVPLPTRPAEANW